MPGTDDDILATIEKNSGDNFNTEQQQPEPQTSPDVTGTPAAKGGEQPTVGEKAPPTPPQPQPQTAEQKAEEERQRAQRNEKGDLVDKNGQIIARAGQERRLYQTLERTRQELDRTKQELEQARILEGVPARLGLSREDVAEGLTLTASFNRDPVGTAQTILAKAIALGHSLEDIVGEAGKGAIQTNALRSMIDERLAPITQATEQRKKQTEIEQQVQSEMEEFQTDYAQDAQLHSDVLAKMMSQDPRQDRPYIVAERAVFRLREWCRENGYDYNRPLKPQVEARQGVQSQPPVQQQQPPQRVQPPQPPMMPNGRGNGAGPSVVEHDAQLPASSSWNDILEQVKKELGGFN